MGGGKGLIERLEANRVAHRAGVEAIRQPGESFGLAEARLLRKRPLNSGGCSTATMLAPGGTSQKSSKGGEVPDFYVPTMYNVGGRDSRNMMDVAVFRLSKREKRAGEMIHYDLPDGYVEVTAGPYGMASIWDYDIVLMLVSHLTKAMNLFREGKGEKPSRMFQSDTTDILKFCRKGDGARQFLEIEAALDRLNGTTIKSVRERKTRNGQYVVREVKSEGLISTYEVVSRTDTGKVASVEIEAPNWIYREVTEGKKPEVLTVHPDYFLISLGIGRFIYRLARKAAGNTSAQWGFKTIYERSGSAGTFYKFTENLRKIIAANELPEYNLLETTGQGGPQLVMTYRRKLKGIGTHELFP